MQGKGNVRKVFKWYGSAEVPVPLGAGNVKHGGVAGKHYESWEGSIRSADRKTGTAIDRDVNLTSDGTFVVDVPNGTYSVEQCLDDLIPTAHDVLTLDTAYVRKDKGLSPTA